MISKRLSIAMVGLVIGGTTLWSGTVVEAQELRDLVLERIAEQQQMNANTALLGAELAQQQAAAGQNGAALQGFARKEAMQKAAPPAQQSGVPMQGAMAPGNTQYNIVQQNGTAGGAPVGLAAMAAAAMGAAIGDDCAVPYGVPVPYGVYGVHGAYPYDRYGAAAAHYGAYRGEEYAHAGEAAGATAAHYGAVQGEDAAARGAVAGDTAAHYGAEQGAQAAARGDAFGHAEAAGGFDHGFGGRGFGGFGGGRFGRR